MKRILVSQRRDPVPGRDETRDSLDVRFGSLLWTLGFLPIPVPSDIPDRSRYIAALSPDGIVLSGGNDIGTVIERDATETALLTYAEQRKIPVFALCRGLQMLNIHQGGHLVEIDGHVATNHRVVGPLFPQGRVVNSYHNHTVTAESLGQELEILAATDDGSVEALRHTRLPWLAVMWHPERETPADPADLDLISRHLSQT